MKLRPFELALIVIFTGLAAVALFILANYNGKEPDPSVDPLATVGPVTIWGTLPAAGIRRVLDNLAEQNEAYDNVSYRYFPPDQFDDALTNALADRVGPDAVLVAHEKLVTLRRRIQPVSYESFPERDIRNLYIDGAQVFALSDGLYGYPLAVDPLMMYWNRDILATEGYLEPPETWEFLINTMFDDLIERDFDRSVNRSVVAMGEYGNVRNAFAIISTLLIQGGSHLVEERNGEYSIKLQSSFGSSGDPLTAAADFYTRFSRPNNTLYSWNRSLQQDREEFIAEDLALYFGFGSEGKEIERLNPNLNFDIAEIPQGATASTRRTYGKFYAFSVLRTANNPVGAGVVLRNLSGSATSRDLANAYNLVPAHRSLVSQGSNDTYGRVTYKSASIALGWLNPDLRKVNPILDTMTKDINENRTSTAGAVSDVSSRLRNAY